MARTGGSVSWGGETFLFNGKYRPNWLWIIYRVDGSVYHYGWAKKRVDAQAEADVCITFPEGDQWYEDYIGEPDNPIAVQIAKRAKDESITEKEAINLHNQERLHAVQGRKIELVSMRGDVAPIDFPF